MSATNRLLLVLLPIVGAVIAFWLLMLAPKRQEASDLETEATDLQARVDEQEQAAAQAEAARHDFPRAYRRLVVLGKAAPEDDDTSSLLVQLDLIAGKSGVAFVSLEAAEGEGAAPAPTATPQTPADTATQDEQKVENVEGGAAATATPPPATEAQAALLPIGASIGPAGLPVMKYTLRFEGDFFHLADFLEGLDDLVETRSDGRVGVRGRLVTVDTFELTPSGASEAGAAGDVGAPTTPNPNPTLSADLEITTYLTPADEGITDGASPSGPAPATEAQPTSAAPPAAGETATASTTTP